LCPEFVATFYSNLKKLYDTHNYEPYHIWNCNESGAQTGKGGGGYVIAKRGSEFVHKVTPNQREWLSVLSCINARGETIPNFFIFKGKKKARNYLKKTCEKGAGIAMQPKAWMTNVLFKAWVLYFLRNLEATYGILASNRHLLVLDGHKSHVTLEVMKLAMGRGLNLITFPSYTSHSL